MQDLLSILDLEPIESNLLRGRSPTVGWQRIYGGLVVSQALVAAMRSVHSGLTPHSLHCYFILPGDPAIPVDYEVENLRDGRSFATRRVVARQKSAAIFALSSSFHIEEEGYEHQISMPAVPAPDNLMSEKQLVASFGARLPENAKRYFLRDRPIELRPVDPARYLGIGHDPDQAPVSVQHVWLRATGKLPDDPLIHRAMLAYASDMTILDTTLVPHGKSFFSPDIQMASLDHAMWFHRPFRADEWLLFSQQSPTTSGALGLAQGSFYSADGRLVASVAQEGLIRPRLQTAA